MGRGARPQRAMRNAKIYMRMHAERAQIYAKISSSNCQQADESFAISLEIAIGVMRSFRQRERSESSSGEKEKGSSKVPRQASQAHQ
jgi:hypothetical protein